MTVSISSAMTASTLQRCRIGKCPHSSPFHQANRKSATLADAPVSAARVGGSAIRSKRPIAASRSEEHTSELQSLMRNSYAVFSLKQINSFTQHNKHLTSTQNLHQETSFYT